MTTTDEQSEGRRRELARAIKEHVKECHDEEAQCPVCALVSEMVLVSEITRRQKLGLTGEEPR